MSTERGVTKRRLSGSEGTPSIESDTANLREQQQQKQEQQQQQEQKQQYKEPPSSSTNRDTSLPNLGVPAATDDENENAKDSSKLQSRASGTVTTATTTEEETTAATAASGDDDEDSRPRQVIAVSANKNPTAFFQLARKFLMTNDMCDLSALEGAIVSAVDAAHLLERSQLASIVKIHTSYVNVEPKRRRQVSQQQQGEVSTVTTSATATEDSLPSVRDDPSSSHQSESISLNTRHAISLSSTAAAAVVDPNTTSVSSVSSTTGGKASSIQQNPPRQEGSSTRSSSGGGGRELRRARILITVKRTESYKRWLDENPLQRQAIIAGDDIGDSNTTPPGPSPSYHHQDEEESQK